MSLDSFLIKYDERVSTLALKGRELILKTIKAVKEDVDVPANMMAYSLGAGYKGMVCTLIFSKKGVKMGFYKATELPDPAKLLEGTGKVHKFVELSDDVLRSKDLLNLLKVAEKACKARLGI
jgi:hypothetical protein